MTEHRSKVVHPDGVARASGRWSHAISVAMAGERLVFVAGQTARQPSGEPLPADDFDAQFDLVYENLGRVLASAGAGFADVVSLRTFLVRHADVARFSELRDRRHGELFPAGEDPPNTLVVVTGLAHPALLLEIEAIAMTPAID